MVKQAIHWGLDPILAVQMATLNAAEYFRLDDLGAIAPGYRPIPRPSIISAGSRSRRYLKTEYWWQKTGKSSSLPMPRTTLSPPLRRKLRIKTIKNEDLLLRSDQPLAKVIELIPGQIVTKKVMKKILLKDGVAYPNLKEDILKIVVIERHRATGNMGIGFVQGFGLKRERSVPRLHTIHTILSLQGRTISIF